MKLSLKSLTPTFMLVIGCCSPVFSQETNSELPFLSAQVGVYSINQDNFDRIYLSSLGFTIGASFGIPFSQSFSFVEDATYFRKTATLQAADYFLYSYFHLLQITNVEHGDAVFVQWLLNTGLEYTINPEDDVNYTLDFGLATALSSEENTWVNGPSNKASYTSYGYYLGASFQQEFVSDKYSLCGSVKYNSFIQKPKSTALDYGGWSIIIGARKYFSF